MAISLDELYSDPDWMLQAGLADIEFEQSMYDDIMYGDPSDELSDEERNYIEEGLGTRLYDYDELALMGLRKHTMEGPMRYIYDDEQKKRRSVYDREKEAYMDYYGQVDVDDPFDPDDNPRTRMDINFNKIIKDWNPSKGTLQDFISDVYRHEYKHPLFDTYLGMRKYKKNFWGRDTDELSENRTARAFKNKYGGWTPADVQHVPIHATGALYGKSNQAVRDDYDTLFTRGNVEKDDLRLGGNLMRGARQDAERAGMLPTRHTGEFWKHDQHPHKYPDQFNRGGLASLV